MFSDNIENPIIPIRSMISNAEKAEKYLPLNYDYTRLVKLNVYCYNSFSQRITFSHWLIEQLLTFDLPI